MKVGDIVKCLLFEKKGVVTGVVDLSTTASLVHVAQLRWSDGKQEAVNVTAYPHRLKILSEEEAQKQSFGSDLADI